MQVITGFPILKSNHSINQVIEVVTDAEKYTMYKVADHNTQANDGGILIFLETKKGCDKVTLQLRMDGRRMVSVLVWRLMFVPMIESVALNAPFYYGFYSPFLRHFRMTIRLIRELKVLILLKFLGIKR
ncbi:DEAD-box ATP-dependent RNA helicase 30 [Artemisia annua]|uniref:DEAD-box ATP-dependent RNA helicase 30 n=1 Tax=Artemisia annua TaxID=35608 RepID=A0A2U1Q7F9_ARTAN|nr:DEAD-box ATP-dependent RNA helicase 30 [Artemisia annua]